jgi:phytoene dehydrogenase-like protein
MTSFDAIIIGGGHNGLVAAAMLGKAKKRVLLLEADAGLGGAARGQNFAENYKSPGLAHILNRLAPDVIRALELDTSAFSSQPAPTVLVDPERAPIILRGGYGERIDGLADDQAGRFAVLREKLIRQAGTLKRFLAKAPPRPGDIGFREALDLGLTGLNLLRQGRAEARDFARMALMNVADIVDEYLTDDRLKGLLAFDATLGVHLGPRSPTSLMGLYYRLTGSAQAVVGGQYLPRGGMGAVIAALENSAKRAGVEIRVSTTVSRLLSDRGAVRGVVTDAGEEIFAPVVVSAIHPAATLRTLAAPGEVDTELSTRMKHYRSKGDAAKLHLALSHMPAFAGVSAADMTGRLVIARSVNHVEAAFNPAKYGQFSQDPVMEITFPSLADPTLAPQGGAVLSAVIQYAPYDLRGGWDEGRGQFLKIALAALERHAPGLSASIQASELLAPPDIEARYCMPGGHWHHGELQVDQMLINRPSFAVSGYATPIAGLYLASAGSHPGGGISGLPGFNAARRILKEART